MSEVHPLDLIGKKALAKRLGINAWTLMRWVDRGLFPKPIRLSEQIVSWRVSDVQRWLDERRDDTEAAEELRQRKVPTKGPTKPKQRAA